MTEKELKKLSRAELLELLLEQTRESERLRMELEASRRMLEDKQLRIKKCGDLAQAVLAINGVMETAQAAAQQYLDNIARMEAALRVHYERMCANAAADTQEDLGMETQPAPLEENLEGLLTEARELIGE